MVQSPSELSWGWSTHGRLGAAAVRSRCLFVPVGIWTVGVVLLALAVGAVFLHASLACVAARFCFRSEKNKNPKKRPPWSVASRLV